MTARFGRYYRQFHNRQLATHGKSGLHVNGVGRRQCAGVGARHDEQAIAACTSTRAHVGLQDRLRARKGRSEAEGG